MRSYTTNKHNRVDDYPYGGGAGLVLMCQPVVDAIKDVREEKTHIALNESTRHTF